jgi:hypothetical protein
MTDKKLILHLCADTGSDSRPYQLSDEYEVFKVGSDIGVENFSAPDNVYGIIANPVCTEFSVAPSNRDRDFEKGMFLVNECLRIIEEAKASGTLKFWVIENPATGSLKDFLGTPTYAYEPWWYGSPWTKRTALWGEFNIPSRVYELWDDVPKLPGLYVRPGRGKPSLAFMHKSAVSLIPEFIEAGFTPDSDMEFRSLCSQKFARAFFEANQ